MTGKKSKEDKRNFSAPAQPSPGAVWQSMPAQVRDAFKKAGLSPEDSIKILEVACQEIAISYSGPIPPPHILRELKEIGVLDDVMHEFRTTSDAQNAERMANVKAIEVQVRCQEKIINSRTVNELFFNIKQFIVVLIVLGIVFFVLYQGIELVKEKNFIWGSIFSGAGIFTVLCAAIYAVSAKTKK
nr:MAG TPA: transmembrane protein [Caudoviricetes sp.]